MPKRFYGHVAKRIHAMACTYPLIASFGELSELVENKCRSWHLDGPNGIDWIIPNSIAAEREYILYVDFVQDITDTAGDYYWTAPAAPPPGSSQYATPDSVSLAQALAQAGASSPEGLAEIADIWRQFVPEPNMHREDLHDLIVHTLDRLAHSGYALDEPTMGFIVSRWPFPLWPLTMKEPRPPDGDLEELREVRQRAIEWIEETEAKRDPAPAISRPKVEELNDAYAAWKRDADARAADRTENEDTGLHIRFRPASANFDLPSYARLQGMFRELTGKERAALLALGWFAREQVADWPRNYESAIKAEPRTDERYQIGCACYWLDGLDRWEEKPQQFQAGRSRPIP